MEKSQFGQNRTSLSVIFSIVTEIRTRQPVNLHISNSFLNVWYRAGYVIHFSPVKICHSARANASQNSHYCMPVLSVEMPSFSKHKGTTFWAVCQTAVLWREGLPLINNTKPLPCPCRCLCAGRKFLISNVCNYGLNVHLVKHHKVLHVDHKRKEPSLLNSVSFAFSPFLMTFIIYSLFWNCFQAFFLFRILVEHVWQHNQA